MIPEINVVRGKKYRFVVEGGENPETPARYHPFYITDDPVGGYQRTLTLECDHGEPGIVEWIPDEDTPDTVYYQVNKKQKESNVYTDGRL